MGTVGNCPHSVLVDTLTLFEYGEGKLLPPKRLFPLKFKHAPPLPHVRAIKRATVGGAQKVNKWGARRAIQGWKKLECSFSN